MEFEEFCNGIKFTMLGIIFASTRPQIWWTGLLELKPCELINNDISN